MNSALNPAAVTAAAKASPLLAQIEAVLSQLQQGSLSAGVLAQLRQHLLSANTREAIAAVLSFLQSDRDAATGETFALGAGGLLEGAPTLRTLLLDLLGQLSRRTGGGEAAAYAREVLAQKTSADEWAVALRNVAWHEPQTAPPFLTAKLREMLAEPNWTVAPSPGLLESFDVVVFAGDPSFVPQMAEFIRGPAPALQRAALVALDRLSETSPLAVMNFLNAHPSELSDRPLIRADYFAKADLSQPAQLAALESYLTRGDASLAEKTKLIQALSAPGSFVANNLLTPPTPPTDSNARREVLTRTLQAWSQTNRFPGLQPVIARQLERLQP